MNRNDKSDVSHFERWREGTVQAILLSQQAHNSYCVKQVHSGETITNSVDCNCYNCITASSQTTSILKTADDFTMLAMTSLALSLFDKNILKQHCSMSYLNFYKNQKTVKNQIW